MSTPKKPPATYFSGLDLGGTQEYTALAVVEKSAIPDPLDPQREVSSYSVRHLERFPLGTSYSEVCTRLRERFAEPSMKRSVLVVDETAVGKPVVKLLRRSQIEAQLCPLAMTAGHKATLDFGTWLVPKKELISQLQVTLQLRRLKIASSLPEAQTLVEELMTYQPKVTLDETLSWRERPHDDLLFALAIAIWMGERMLMPGEWFAPHVLASIPDPFGGRW